MFPTWRLQLREAHVAVESGRYEEAIALLGASRSASFCRPSDWRRTWRERWSRGPATGSPAATRRPAGRIWQWPTAGRPERSDQQAAASNTPPRRSTRSAAIWRRASRRRHWRGWRNCTARDCWARRRRMLQQIANSMHDGPEGGRSTAISPRPPRPSNGPRGWPPRRRPERVQWRSPDSSKRKAASSPAGSTEGQRLSAELHAALSEQDWSAVLSRGRSAAGDRAAARGGRQARRRAWKAVGMDVTHAMHRGAAGGAGVAAIGTARPVPAADARRGPAHVPARSIP